MVKIAKKRRYSIPAAERNFFLRGRLSVAVSLVYHEFGSIIFSGIAANLV